MTYTYSKKPLISCLCVTYNRPEFHGLLLWNFNKQTWPNRELIVVDGSSVNYADRFESENIRYFYLADEPNIPLKRNLALDNAAGEFITWFDDDDWQHPKKCEWLVSKLQEGFHLAGSGKSLFFDLNRQTSRDYDNRQVLFNSLGVRREVARQVRFNESKIRASDTEWCASLFNKSRGRIFNFDKRVLFFWLCHQKNISNPVHRVDRRGTPREPALLKELPAAEQQEFKQLLVDIRNGSGFQSRHKSKGNDSTMTSNKSSRSNGKSKFRMGVSVVVAVRNRCSGQRVANFLKSLRHQPDWPSPLEVIIVDSCSSPSHYQNAYEAATRYDATLLRIEKAHQWNKSLALNVGIKAAKYRYVMLTDIDMIFQENFLKVAVDCLEGQSGRAILHCQARDLPQSAISPQTDIIRDFAKLKAVSTLHGKQGTGACFMARTDWLQGVGAMDERYVLWGAMDNDMSYRAGWDGLKIIWLEKTTFLHQWHEKKTVLWQKDPEIREVWMENHRLLKKYSDAFARNRPLPDQVIRNPQGWGDIEHEVHVRNGKKVKADNDRPPIAQKAAAAGSKTSSRTAEKPVDETTKSSDKKNGSERKKRSTRKNLKRRSKKPRVAIAFNTCPGDADFIDLVIPHVIKQCRYDFQECLVFSDRSRPTGKYANSRRFNDSAYDKKLKQLLDQKIVDTIIEVSQMSSDSVNKIGRHIPLKAHNGSPTLSYAASMMMPEADYILRLDSDMLFYSAPNFSWVEEGIQRIENDPSILFFMANPGPFTSNLRQTTSFRPGVNLRSDLLVYPTVTTRYFLFKKERFLQCCPLPLRGNHQRMEIVLSDLLRISGLRRVCLHTPHAWHLHTNAAAWAFQHESALEELIFQVENNQVPSRQLGRYNLDYSWVKALGNVPVW